MKKIPYILLLIGVCLAGCASQKDVLILDERLMVLERQNQELQRQNSQLQKQISKDLEKYGKSSQNAEISLRDRYATLTADLDKIHQDTLVLSGRMEEVNHHLERQMAEAKQRQEKVDELNLLAARLDQRITEIEKYLNFERSGSGKTPAGAPASRAAAVPATGDGSAQLYDDAKRAFDNGQMERARQGFQQFLKSYPKSANADNAQFWIGETYYKEKWYEKAILEYQAVIEKYPKGNKVAAAMLKQGMAFLHLGDKPNARLILKELVKKYPKSNEAAIAGKKLKEI